MTAFAEQLVDERELFAVGYRIERQRGRAGARVELVEPELETLAGAPHDDALRGVRVARSELRVGRCPLLAEPHVVGVRVEDDETKVGLDQEPLQHEPERVRLPRARLAAEEGVPVEPAGVERRGYARRKQELADRQRGSRRPNRCQPLGHLGGLGRPRERIVERLAVTGEDDALAASRAKHHPRSQLIFTVAARQLGAVDSSELERHDLAEPPSVIALEHDIRADLQLESVQRRLETRSSVRRPTSRAGGSTPRSSAATRGTQPSVDRVGSSRSLVAPQAAEADVAHAGVDHLRPAGRGAVAQAVAVGAQERAALDHLARHPELRLRGS